MHYTFITTIYSYFLTLDIFISAQSQLHFFSVLSLSFTLLFSLCIQFSQIPPSPSSLLFFHILLYTTARSYHTQVLLLFLQF